MKRSVRSIIRIYTYVYQFIVHDLWKIRLSDLSSKRAFWYKYLRIIVLTIKNYMADDIGIKASALTFYSLLSIVPVLALVFGVADFFGLKETLQNQLRIFFSGQEIVMQKTYEFAQTMLSTAKGGVIAGIGLIFLIYTIMRLFYSIEESFNFIWRVKRSRSLPRVISDYLLLIILGPFILIFSVSFNVFINAQLTGLSESFDFMHYLSPAISFMLKSIPYILIWLLFTLMYFIMPNTKVNFGVALVAGIIGGTIYQVTQWGYINFQVGVSRYNAIYGSFAALPLFLLWIQISWLIVLLGAEFSHAYQNIYKFGYDNKMLVLTQHSRNKLLLRVASLIVKRFKNEGGGLSIQKLNQQVALPVRYISTLLDDLINAGIINEIRSEDDNRLFQPAIHIEKLTVAFVLDKINRKGEDEIKVNRLKNIKEIDGHIERLSTAMKDSQGNVHLYQL